MGHNSGFKRVTSVEQNKKTIIYLSHVILDYNKSSNFASASVFANTKV